ncbi:unnamed protein product [Caenorhabditis auriculariae]|uniref:Uncharacterized protein n=1 Tax=Caenorhabditis auriculariae TaxID=2777116 RepID=A0A8S1H4U4_9PELO|nr:unnamed protein product [Caenorhabditis auriculariae]
MDNLLTYYPDSDEESPRRRSNEVAQTSRPASPGEDSQSNDSDDRDQRRKRQNSDTMFDDDEGGNRSDYSDRSQSQNFVEPPPPQRVVDHSPSPAFRTPASAFPQNSSQLSLVSYGGEEEAFQSDSENTGQKSTPQSEALHEPRPPGRQSQESDEEEEERLIDLALEESKTLFMEQDESSSLDVTPTREDALDSPIGDATDSQSAAAPEFANEDEIQIPSAPDKEVNEDLQNKFEKAFWQKDQGVNLNKAIQSRQDFSNPMSYERFIETFEIDEKGTNFESHLFDPHCISENCFYDKIAELQRKQMEAHTHPTGS